MVMNLDLDVGDGHHIIMQSGQLVYSLEFPVFRRICPGKPSNIKIIWIMMLLNSSRRPDQAQTEVEALVPGQLGHSLRRSWVTSNFSGWNLQELPMPHPVNL
ncbi:hypothetical protein TNCV_2388031 [Trichonephila clavipes]|nr:hypothetical protein TNCV_2388031 [Trichonephila clavipes]